MGREMGDKSVIDIIVPTHNNLKMTAWCIDALYEWTHTPFRLTVVDDSTDLTPDYIAELQKKHDNIQYLRPKEKLTSMNQIVNIALKHTENELVVLCVNNCFVQPNWADIALQFMRDNKDVGLLGFKILFPSGAIEHAGIHFHQGIGSHLNYGVGEPGHSITVFKQLSVVGWALAMFRRQAIPSGGLETDYYLGFSGLDDVDNCLQMKKNGWRIFYCGYGTAYHYAHATSNEDIKLMERMELNRKRFFARWGKALFEEGFAQEEDDDDES